ncbi:hypothetical protein G3N95_08935, partial [Paraburkholderia sp. Tr-20389]|nr:hypothetical protein [Paraburkholderia sp. Tr-20389]
ANAGANDSLGLAGYGETANVNGSGTTVWTGQNGFGASGAADDRVNFASGVVGTVNVYDNSHVDMSGTSITANAGANDSLGLAGYGETANVNGSGTTVWTGQNGFGASGAADDRVNFASGVVGTVDVYDNSHVDMSGTSITANAGANDALGLAGYGETANVNGLGTTVWTGLNGFGASGAADDRVNFASGVKGTVDEFDNSHVDVNGNSITANLGANDALGLAGYGETANVSGSGTTVWTGLNGQNATTTNDDIVRFLNGVTGTVDEFANSRIDVSGGGITLNAAANDTAGISGNHDTISDTGTGGNFWLAGTNDQVSESGGSVTLDSGSTAGLAGGSDSVNLLGSGDIVALASGSGYTVNGMGIVGVFGGQSDSINLSSGDELLYNASGTFYRALQYNNSYVNDSIGFSGNQETDEEFYNSAHQETEGAWFNSGSYAYQVSDFNTGTEAETERENFNSASGALNSVDLWNGAGPHPYEEEFANGGLYFNEIAMFNPTSGVMTGGATFNSQTGLQTAWYDSDNGNWYNGSGSSAMSDYSDEGWQYEDDDAMGDSDWEDDDIDPVILNLNGGKVETTATADSQATFDINNTGQAVQTAWGTAGEGYLVYDPNDSGNTTTITRDNQLIDSMDDLKALAQNVDGSAGSTLTATDALWSNLKVWVDTTGTGQFQSGQLYSLSDLGIASLDLNGVQVDRYDNGNEILNDSSFTRTDGTKGDMAGVALAGSGISGASGNTAASIEAQMQALVAGMASFGAAPPSGGTVASAMPAQNEPQMLLVSNAH